MERVYMVSNLVNRLINRIDVYGKIPFENELGEKDYNYGKIKRVWSEIIPTGGNVKSLEGNNIYAEVSHRITIRVNSIPNLSNDMYFMYKEQRFDIKFFQPSYKYKDAIEIMCNLVVE